MTIDDLMDICGPGTYRLYALDEMGAVLDYVVDVEVGTKHRTFAFARHFVEVTDEMPRSAHNRLSSKNSGA